MLDDGRVVLGGNYGLTIIQPSRLSHVSGLTDVVFTSYPYSDEITLTYRAAFAQSIRFYARLFRCAQCQVHYRLEGYDQDIEQTFVHALGGLSETASSQVCLHVKACTSDGTWGKEVTCGYVVKPPFYLTSWAIMIYVLLVLGVIILVVKFVHDKMCFATESVFEQELTSLQVGLLHQYSPRVPYSSHPDARLAREGEAHHESQPLADESEKAIRVMDKSVQRMFDFIDQLLEFRTICRQAS